MTKAFADMLGQEILSYVRDMVAAVAVDKRSFSNSRRLSGARRWSREELAELAALDAAAEMIQFAVSAGQEAKGRGKSAPDWVLRMAAQARTALVAEEEYEAEA